MNSASLNSVIFWDFILSPLDCFLIGRRSEG
nr:MAG TPA: hypothetical protein [Caudoviricetes sp.]